MKLSTSVKTALVILAALVLYFGVRTLTTGERAAASDPEPAAPFSVIATTVAPQSWQDRVVVRGRTAALRKITLRAETAGAVAATPVEPGNPVSAGDVICRLNIDAREASLGEARAAYARAKLEHDAAVELAREGFRSETGVAAARAALDLAGASLEQAEIAVTRTNIAAPWDGVLDERSVDVGDYMNTGDACGVLIEQSPFLITGSVSERDIAKIRQGDRGVARLATGETIEGRVRFVAKAADPATRTFDVELEVPNEDGELRDGVTAQFVVNAAGREAHLLPRSALTLDDSGRIGVRLVDADDRVAFAAVALLGETAEGVWVDGLDGAVRLITRGQDFVTDGQKVAVAEPGDEA